MIAPWHADDGQSSLAVPGVDGCCSGVTLITGPPPGLELPVDVCPLPADDSETPIPLEAPEAEQPSSALTAASASGWENRRTEPLGRRGDRMPRSFAPFHERASESRTRANDVALR